MVDPVAGQNRTYYGPAMKSCGTWTTEVGAGLSEKTSPVGMVMQAWVAGFVTAASAIMPTVAGMHLAPTDSLGMNKWITQYCTAHPVDNLLKATSSLVAELMQRGK